jgi:hypothetical protein
MDTRGAPPDGARSRVRSQALGLRKLLRRHWTPVAAAMAGIAAVAAMLAGATLAANPAPPFAQCPAIGKSASCGILIVLNPDGTTTIIGDPAVGPYDGRDDTLVGVVNNTRIAITKVTLSSTLNIFALDGDGICASSITPHPAGCPFGTTKYEGPGTSYTIVDSKHGTVNFTGGGLAPAASTYFGLESRVQAAQITIPQPPSNKPPVCSGASATPNVLWPPNHKLVTVTVGGVTDPDGDAVTITITGVTQDEALNGLGSGDTSPDAATGAQSNQVQLRAERAGTGDGRVYRIAFSASDGKDGTCTGTVKVSVPRDQSGSSAIDSGKTVNSFGP